MFRLPDVLQAADFLDDQETLKHASHDLAQAAFPVTQAGSTEGKEDQKKGGSIATEKVPDARQVLSQVLQALLGQCADACRECAHFLLVKALSRKPVDL